MTFRVGVCSAENRKALAHNEYKNSNRLLPTLLPTKDHGFHFAGGILDPILADVVIDTEDHFLVGMAHPPHGQLDVYTRISEHGAVAMSKVMRPDGKLSPGR